MDKFDNEQYKKKSNCKNIKYKKKCNVKNKLIRTNIHKKKSTKF